MTALINSAGGRGLRRRLAGSLPRDGDVLALGAAALVLGAPLVWGGVPAPAQLAIRLAALLLVAAAVWLQGCRRAARRVRLPLLALGALAGLGLLQSLPLPAPLVGLLSPRHLALVGGAQGWASLSLAPEISRSVGLSLAAAASLLLVGAVCGARSSGRRWIVGAVLAGGGVQAAHGLRGLNLEGRPRLSGTFFNPDHCALYLEICVTLAAAVTWWFLRNRRRLSMDATVVGAAVGGGLWLGFLFALGLTGSRAALVAAGAGCAVQGVLVLVWSRGGRKHLGLAAAALALASGALVAASHYGPVLARLAVFDLSDSNIALRWAIWRDSLTLLGSFPLTGTGLGTFLEAFALVQSPATVGVRWVRAHNDLVELLVTAGAVGAVAVALTLVGVGRRLYRLAAAGDTEGRAAVLALAGVLAAVAVHEMADFGASLPGNWVALVVVTGALLGSPSAGGLRRVRDGRRRSARAGGSRRESGEPG